MSDDTSITEENATQLNIATSDTQQQLDPTEETISTELVIEDKDQYLEQELSRLRELITIKTNENLALETKLQECEQQSNLQIEQLNQNFTMRLEQTLKKFQEGHKDKTSSLVMKYAEGEKRCIDLNRSLEHLQHKLQDAIKEKQSFSDKFDKLKQDNQKLNSDYEQKCQEVLSVKKELKETIIISEAREKACQLKLKQEIEDHDLTKQQTQAKNEKEETTETTITESAAVTEQDEKFDRTIRELNALKSQLKDMFEERTTLRDKLHCMDQERKLQESSLSKYKETLQNQKQMNKDLLTEILQLRELQETLTKEQLEKEHLETKFKLLNSELLDLQSDMSASQEKQNELLLFTSKLTEKNSKLQSENTSLTEKLQLLQTEYSTSALNNNQTNETLQSKLDDVSQKLKIELDKNVNLTEQLNEKQKQIDDLSIQLSDEQSESVSLKKKHTANIKDLSRQLQQLQKKLNEPNSPVLKQIISRTNSINSLNERESIAGDLLQVNSSTHRISDDDSRSFSSETQVTRSVSNNHFNEVICGNDDVYVVDIDKQKIIEKIVKLQKTLAKRNEKIDFLQDHVNMLTNDLKRKTKIIQAYAMNEEVGQFTSEAHDAIKREMSRKTGSIMSSLYNNHNKNDSQMTMELCSEINSKLQALLEDTLIKNLTLKDSLETLGQEISRLSKENRQIKLNSLQN